MEKTTNMPNLFIATRIREPEILRELNISWACVSGTLPQIAQPQRAGPPHITLRYLGNLDIDQPEQDPIIQELSQQMHKTAQRFESFELLLGYLHTFPGILWASVGGANESMKAISRMHKRIDQAANRSQLPDVPKRHDFIPHITLGKFDHDATPVVQEIIRDSRYPSQVYFKVDQLELLQSSTDDNNATVYTTIGTPAPLS